MQQPVGVSGRPSRETWIALVTLTAILLHLVLRYPADAPRWVAALPLQAILVLGGVPLLAALARKLVALDFGSDLLAGISIVTSAFLGEYLVGAIVVPMLSGGCGVRAICHAPGFFRAGCDGPPNATPSAPEKRLWIAQRTA